MKLLPVAAAVVLWAAPRPADACGGYVSHTEFVAVNDAIELVVVRDGTRTEISVRNRYRGPIEEFALLVPVPQVLHVEDVHTLDPSVFDALAALTAPKLEFLQERDPCEKPSKGADGSGASGSGPGGARGSGATVQVEAAFQVGEYDVEVLSATDAAGLATWLTEHRYRISDAMAPLLRPYVEGGSKFFVAKVDPKRVKFVDGVATLSPLRFGYDADEISLPLRLSTANSPGKQDVLVHVIAPHTVEAANRPNQRIPSGLWKRHDAPGGFSDFYEAVFAATLAKHPGAVITEFSGRAWVGDAVLGALGAIPEPRPNGWSFDGVVTRLHLRLDKDGVQDDLVLRSTGGNAWFQASYAQVRPWTDAPTCADPKWGNYAPDQYASIMSDGPGFGRPVPERAPDLADLVATNVPSLGVTARHPWPDPPARRKPRARGGCCDTGGAPGSTLLLVLFAVLALRRHAAR